MFFVIGSGRSGTTLLRRILLSSPELYIPPELLGLPHAVRWYRRHSYMDWPSLVAGCLAKIQFNPSYQYVGVDLAPVFEELCQIDQERRALSRLLYSVYGHLAVSSGRGNVWLYGDKTPALTAHAQKMSSVFPEAKFIHVIRDPIDVVASFVREGLRDVDDAARLWVRRTKSARKLERSFPDRCITVRYEQLVAAPTDVAKRVADFLGLRSDELDVDSVNHVSDMGDVVALPHHRRVSAAITAQRVGWGGRVLTSEDIERVEAIVHKERGWWGYRA